MRALLAFVLLYCMFFSVAGDDTVNQFITDTISAFGFTSPTILYHGDMPEICLTRQWVLCLDYEYEQTILLDKKGTPSVLSSKLIKWMIILFIRKHFFISPHFSVL